MNLVESPDPAALPCEGLPATISALIEGAVAAFDTDRDTSRRYLLRASALLRAKPAAPAERPCDRETPGRGGFAAWQRKRVIDHIESHLTEKITGNELAKLVDVSVGQLFRAFRVSVGVPPFRYIVQRRIELACRIMQTTDEPLSQVAIACGLCDQSHFCRMFRRATGLSPAAWRRANAVDPRTDRAGVPAPATLVQFTAGTSNTRKPRELQAGTRHLPVQFASPAPRVPG